MQLLLQHIEALIFVSEQPIAGDEILSCLKTAYGWELKKEQFHSLIAELKEKYQAEEYSFELVEIAEGFQFLTKKEYHHAVSTLLQIKAKKRLSTAALETLAIIAYKQPLSKSEIEHIRGVNCDYSIQKLLEKELIVISGKGDGPGKPLLYATSKNFMDHFGLKSVKELPKLKDLHIAENEIGTPSDLMDSDVPVDIDPDAIPVDLPDGSEGTVIPEAENVEYEEGGEFIIEGTVDAEAGLGNNLEQDLLNGEEQSEQKEE
ncbi:MAG: SMC-Scp complex subunit ScpB [Bacteroidia bacterium]